MEEFKKALGAEVHKSMTELGRMREEKKALEQNISDLFALKAKHGMASRSNVSVDMAELGALNVVGSPPLQTKKSPVTGPIASAAPSPHSGYVAAFGRGLPVAPGRH